MKRIRFNTTFLLFFFFTVKEREKEGVVLL
jgi:hypothetical protein